MCFESVNGVISCCIYKGGVKTQSASQTQWALDKMDGCGSSQKELDLSKAQIFVIDYEWLGVGRIRYGFNIDGVTHYVHEFNNANNITDVYMRSGNQPMRYEIRSTGGSGAMKHICTSAQSEGGFNPKGLIANTGAGNTGLTIGSAWELIYAIRLKSTNLDATVEVNNISVITISNVNYEVGLFWNPIIAGTPAWTDLTGASLPQWIVTGRF